MDILSVAANFPPDKMSSVHWITCATDILSVAANFPPDKMSSVHWITRMTDILSVAPNFPTDKLPALQLPGRAKLAGVASSLRNSSKVKPMSQDNSGLVLRWFDEVWNQRRAETIDELMTAQSVCYTDQGPMRGTEEFRALQYRPLLEAFPDLHVAVDGILADGDDVVVRWTANGTHSGAGLPIGPTMKPAVFTGISWIRVRDGKFAEGWQSSNIATVIRELAEPARSE